MVVSAQKNLPLCVFSLDNRVFYLQKQKNQILVYESKNAKEFIKTDKVLEITNSAQKNVLPKDLTYLSISGREKHFTAILGFGKNFYEGVSDDGFSWELLENLHEKLSSGFIVPDYLFKNEKVLYWGDHAIRIGTTSDKKSWNLYDDPIFTPDSYHQYPVEVIGLFCGKKNNYVPFVSKIDVYGQMYFTLSIAIFSRDDPRKVIRRFPYPIWVVPQNLVGHLHSAVGICELDGKIYSFWSGGKQNELISFRHPLLESLILDEGEILPNAGVKKVDDNPILTPDKNNSWESLAVFNPTALYDEEKEKVHMLYRAVGDDWRSVFGYANSNDGIHIDSKLDSPAYVPRTHFEGQNIPQDPGSPFSSGPGIGGCEDPRLTRIGDRVYLTYVAYDGWSGPRVSLSSISYSDFEENLWNWSDPVLISKPGVIDKNAVIFPEKINGRYAIMHRVFPDILIDYVDSLDFDGKTFLAGEHKISPRPFGWDSRKIGAGPPPVKTDLGWLLIYHGVDDLADHKYQIGAMILDLKDPTKVLYRSTQPIISPTDW